MELGNTQFVFEGKLKRNLLIGMAVGAACLAWSAVGDDQYHTRFWSNFLHNSLFFTGMAMMALFFMSASITAFGGWITTFKRVWESMTQFLWVGMILMGVMVVAVFGHLTHLYHWNTPGVAELGSPTYDRILAGKKSFLNPIFYTIATVGFLGLWYFIAKKIRDLSVAQDENETASFDYYKKIRKWAAAALPIVGFLSPAFIWLALMSIDGHWYSTMFAWYSSASMFLGMISLTIMVIIYLKSKGYMEYVTREHLHDLGKYMFGISVFWTYLWFSQFMLIWYANNGEETIYFNERMTHYPVLFWGNLLLNFVTPFLILMRNDTKRKMGTLFFVGAIVFFGHWWDYFYMVKPGARIAAHEAMELAEGKHGHSAAPAHSEAAKTAVAHDDHAAADTSHAAAAAHDDHAAAAAHDDHVAGGHEGKPESHDAAAHGEGETAKAEAAAHDNHAAEGHTATAAAGHAGDHGDAHGAADPSKAFKIGYTIPGFQEIGVMIGFLSLFLFFLFSQLQRASLVPAKDPFFEESLHHATGAHIDSEHADH